jgi:hypothetical protein
LGNFQSSLIQIDSMKFYLARRCAENCENLV